MGCVLSNSAISALTYETITESPIDGGCYADVAIPSGSTAFGCGSTTLFQCAVAGQTLLVEGVEADDGMYEFTCPARTPGSSVGTNNYDLGLHCEATSGGGGDPHVKKWDQTWYDWQGECDNVFLHAPDYRRGGVSTTAAASGLDIHVRTKIRYDYSFMESVAVRIGSDIFEVYGFGGSIFNGVSSPEYPLTMGDCCNITSVKSSNNKHQHDFNIDLGEGAKLDLSTFKDMVSIKVSHTTNSPITDEWFGSSVGMMGTYQEGKTVARDGITLLEDPNDLGQEWQVLDSDPKLFQNQDRAPQFPEKCRLPGKKAAEKRRLVGGGISLEEATKACAHNKNEDEKVNCIKDVMATNDLEVATVHF